MGDIANIASSSCLQLQTKRPFLFVIGNWTIDQLVKIIPWAISDDKQRADKLDTKRRRETVFSSHHDLQPFTDELRSNSLQKDCDIKHSGFVSAFYILTTIN